MINELPADDEHREVGHHARDDNKIFLELTKVVKSATSAGIPLLRMRSPSYASLR